MDPRVISTVALYLPLLKKHSSPTVNPHQVANTNGNCMGDAYDWLVSFMFFLGDLCWLPAVYCMMLEAINKDYEDRLFEPFLCFRYLEDESKMRAAHEV